MATKTVLITGANSGLGYAAACRLCDKGYHVVLLCRDAKRGTEALERLKGEKPGRSAELALCDLGSMKDIRRFAAEFLANHKTLDVLVNNAGVISLDRRETADGLEQQFGVNHMGHFLLTLLLLPALCAAPAGRVVVYSSGAHKVGRIHYDDINLTRRYNVVKAYSQSKLANLLFARELAKRLEKQGESLVVNACHPGAVATQMGVNRDTGFGKTVLKLLRPFFLTPDEGARTAVYLAADGDAGKTSGGYYYRCNPAKISRRAKNPLEAKRLFMVSEKLCGEYYPPKEEPKPEPKPEKKKPAAPKRPAARRAPAAKAAAQKPASPTKPRAKAAPAKKAPAKKPAAKKANDKQ